MTVHAVTVGSGRGVKKWCEKKVCVNIKEKVPKTTWNGPEALLTFTLFDST